MSNVSVTANPTRAEVIAFEDQIRTLPPVDAPVTNHFAHGVYGREVFVPAGSTLTGHIHKFTNMNVLLSGEMSVLTEEGIQTVSAGFVVVSPPGTKRVAHAHTDCRWLTVHGTHETEIDVIEREFIAHSEQEFIAFCESQHLIEGK